MTSVRACVGLFLTLAPGCGASRTPPPAAATASAPSAAAATRPAIELAAPTAAAPAQASRTATQPATRPAATRSAATTSTRPTGFARWEKEIAAYEAADRRNPPPAGGGVFIGSSTIRMWSTLAEDFPGRTVINRGFGGSRIADSTHFAERILFPYAPRQVFLRAGGNDIHEGQSFDAVFQDFKDFAAKVRAKLPEAEVVFISLSPAPARWDERDANRALNALIKAYCAANPGLKYVETYDMTLTPDGRARDELFVADRLHFNAQGYRLLAERVRPFVR